MREINVLTMENNLREPTTVVDVITQALITLYMQIFLRKYDFPKLK